MYEATGKLIAREGLRVSRGGQDYVMVRVTDDTPMAVWTVWEDGEEIRDSELPSSREVYDDYATVDGRKGARGQLGFIAVDKPEAKSVLPTDKMARKEMPIARGVIDYFPRAMAAIANVSYVGNQQHNPGEPMHWARGKSTDHADCIARHLIERGTLDADGLRHSAKLAWRALALLEEELENS